MFSKHMFWKKQPPLTRAFTQTSAQLVHLHLGERSISYSALAALRGEATKRSLTPVVMCDRELSEPMAATCQEWGIEICLLTPGIPCEVVRA